MEKYITDERTGLKYELVGDYYLIAGDDEPDEEQKPIGIWGQRHLSYLKNHRKVLYANLLTSGKLNDYLADIDRQAKEMFERLVMQMAAAEGIWNCRVLQDSTITGRKPEKALPWNMFRMHNRHNKKEQDNSCSYIQRGTKRQKEIECPHPTLRLVKNTRYGPSDKT